MQVPHHSFAILSPSTSWSDGYFLNPQYRSVGQISMVLGQNHRVCAVELSRFGGIPFLYLVMLKIPRFGSFRTIAAVMSLFQNAGGYLKMTILLWQMGYYTDYTVPIWDLQAYRYLFCVRSRVPKEWSEWRSAKPRGRWPGLPNGAQLDSWDLWSTYS